MKTKSILMELIELLESFEATVPKAEEMSLESFLSFALSIHQSNRPRGENNIEGNDDAYIAQMVSLLHRYSRSYTKKALSASEYLQTEEEYSYLICLLSGVALSKSELHQRNGLERTTGNEMLRRLHRHGLIEEEADSQDRRQILVRITAKGKQELGKVLPELRIAAQLLSAPLDEQQRLFFKHTLKSLCTVHSSWVIGLREMSLKELAQGKSKINEISNPNTSTTTE